MKQQQRLKLIAITAYLLIILAGDMIGIPFCIWLLLVSFDFGNADQLFAILAIVGLVISLRIITITPKPKTILLDVVCFVLLASPLVKRMAVVPLEKFNYLAFIIPVTTFVLLHLLSICLSVKRYQQEEKNKQVSIHSPSNLA